VVEIFLFDSTGGKGTVKATARGLLEDDGAGEATDRPESRAGD